MNGLTHDASPTSLTTEVSQGRTAPLAGSVLSGPTGAVKSIEGTRANERMDTQGEGETAVVSRRGRESGKKSLSPDHAPVSMYHCTPTEMPQFLTAYVPTVS